MIRTLLTVLGSGLIAAIYVVLIVLLITGCSVHGWEMSVAEESCKGHHGVDYISGLGIAMCNDGMSYGLVRN